MCIVTSTSSFAPPRWTSELTAAPHEVTVILNKNRFFSFNSSLDWACSPNKEHLLSANVSLTTSSTRLWWFYSLYELSFLRARVSFIRLSKRNLLKSSIYLSTSCANVLTRASTPGNLNKICLFYPILYQLHLRISLCWKRTCSCHWL